MSSTITTRLDEHPEELEDQSAGAARRSDPDPELADRVRQLLPDGVIDELLAGASSEEQITGHGGLLGQLTKRLVERAMGSS